MKKSRAVVLVLSGALVTGLGPVGCHRPPDASDSATNNLKDQEQPDEQDNNAYTPGVGYYHSPFHAWYPYPFNFYQPSRGYFYGGGWHDRGYDGPAPARTRPSSAGWSAARSALHGSGAGFSSSGTHSSGSVIRGGFGASSHFSGGS